MATRICSECSVEKDLSSFKLKSSTGRCCFECRREKDRWRQLRKCYGVTKPIYEAMFISQGGVCKLCSMTPEENGQALAVDHCHDTGKVRGLLCKKCNLMLGYSLDNIKTLANAIAYLQDD